MYSDHCQTSKMKLKSLTSLKNNSRIPLYTGKTYLNHKLLMKRLPEMNELELFSEPSTDTALAAKSKKITKGKVSKEHFVDILYDFKT